MRLEEAGREGMRRRESCRGVGREARGVCTVVHCDQKISTEWLYRTETSRAEQIRALESR